MRALPWLVPVAGKQACSLGIDMKGRRPKPTPQVITGVDGHTIHPSSRALATAA